MHLCRWVVGRVFMGWLDLAVLSAPPKLHLGFLSVPRDPAAWFILKVGLQLKKELDVWTVAAWWMLRCC